MSAMAIQDKEFGMLLGEVKSIQKDLAALEKRTEGLDTKVDGILARFDRIDGGLSVAIWASGIIGALGMFALTKLTPFLVGFLPKI